MMALSLQEYLANTNPRDATSYLHSTGFQRTASGYWQITWASVGGTRYRVFSCDGHKLSGCRGWVSSGGNRSGALRDTVNANVHRHTSASRYGSALLSRRRR